MYLKQRLLAKSREHLEDFLLNKIRVKPIVEGVISPYTSLEFL